MIRKMFLLSCALGAITISDVHAQRDRDRFGPRPTSGPATIVRTDASGKPVTLRTCTTMACCKHNRTVLLKKPWTPEAQAYCQNIVATYGRR